MPQSIDLDAITGFKRLAGGGLALRGLQGGQEIVINVPPSAVPSLVQHAIGGMELPTVGADAQDQTPAFNITAVMAGQADNGKHTVTMYLDPQAAITFLLNDEQMGLLADSRSLLGQKPAQ